MATSASKNADGKFADMAKDTVEVNHKQHMTTDYGIKISDPDHWLRVANDQKTGPMLLEDQIAREKVCSPLSVFYQNGNSPLSRSCASTTSVFPSE